MDYTSIDYQDFLAHHGIEGQKWGVQNGPPYPLDPEKRTNKAKEAAAKLAETGKSIVKKTKAAAVEASKKRAEDKVKTDEKKAERKAKSDAKKEAKAAKKDAKEKEFKDKVIRDGDLKTLSQNKEKFTNEEITQCIARYQLNTRVDDLYKPEEKSAADKAAETVKKVKKVKKYVDLGRDVAGIGKELLDAYNTTAEVVNSVAGQEKMKPLKFTKENKQVDGKKVTRLFDEDGFKYQETVNYKQGNDTYTDTRKYAKKSDSSTTDDFVKAAASKMAKDFASEMYKKPVQDLLEVTDQLLLEDFTKRK